ncbi:hypothetical protein WL91_12920 [Burkholderia multivorans]|nr:hypothetical protein WL91_12920 [Burkholderia multivorans]
MIDQPRDRRDLRRARQATAPSCVPAARAPGAHDARLAHRAQRRDGHEPDRDEKQRYGPARMIG